MLLCSRSGSVSPELGWTLNLSSPSLSFLHRPSPGERGVRGELKKLFKWWKNLSLERERKKNSAVQNKERIK